jgi:hypothetical protein
VTNFFLDTEFTDLPWKKHSTLISIGIYTEDQKAYYASSKDFERDNCSQFVKENVLPQIKNEKSKSRSVIANELTTFVRDYDKVQFWAVFPTIDQINFLNDSTESNQEIYNKYKDYDFQLMMDLWKSPPLNIIRACNDLAPLINKYKNELPNNNAEHQALADAEWNFRLWRMNQIDNAI